MSNSLWRHVAARQASLSITNSQSLLKLISIESVISSHLILCQPSHPLSSPSPPAFNLSQHQSLFQWVSSLHHVAKVLELQLQHQSFQWMFRIDFLYDWLVWSLCSPGDFQESSPTSQFKSINSSVLSLLYVQLSHPYTHGWINEEYIVIQNSDPRFNLYSIRITYVMYNFG